MKKLLVLLLVVLVYTSYGQMPNTISKSEKVYGLSKFWQEVNYNFIYLDKVDHEAWDKMYKELIEEVQKTENDYEYYRLLQKFCATLKDGHTNVYFPDKIREKILNTNFGDYRLFLKNIDGKALITNVNSSKKDEIPVGSEIVKVNGQKTQKYIDEYVKPYISSSTDYVLEDNAVRKMFAAPEGTTFEVEFKLPDGKQKIMNLTHAKTEEKEVYPPFEKRELLTFKWLPDDVAYVALNSFGDANIVKLFEENLPELYKAKKLIIDLRNNGGGSSNHAVSCLQYLTNDTVLYGSKMSSRLHIPAYKAWGSFVKVSDTAGNKMAVQAYLSGKDQYYHYFEQSGTKINHDKKRLVVPTVVLIGHGTASAAEDFLIYADKQSHFTKMGEPTFGSTGQPIMFDMPGGGSARVCTKKDTYPDGKEFVGYGIQPDVFVKKTIDDYRKNNDPALDKAVEYLKKK